MVLKTPTRALPPRKRKWTLGSQQCRYSLSVFTHAKLSYHRNLDLCFNFLSNHWTKLLLFLPSILHRFTVLPTHSQTCISKWYTHTHTHTHTPYSFLCHCCSSFPNYRLSSGDSQYFQGWYRTTVRDWDYHDWESRFPNKCFGSVQFSGSVVSDSLRPHESQHTRPPCSSPTLGVYPNSWTSVYTNSNK